MGRGVGLGLSGYICTSDTFFFTGPIMQGLLMNRRVSTTRVFEEALVVVGDPIRCADRIVQPRAHMCTF